MKATTHKTAKKAAAPPLPHSTMRRYPSLAAPATHAARLLQLAKDKARLHHTTVASEVDNTVQALTVGSFPDLLRIGASLRSQYLSEQIEAVRREEISGKLGMGFSRQPSAMGGPQ